VPIWSANDLFVNQLERSFATASQNNGQRPTHPDHGHNRESARWTETLSAVDADGLQENIINSKEKEGYKQEEKRNASKGPMPVTTAFMYAPLRRDRGFPPSPPRRPTNCA